MENTEKSYIYSPVKQTKLYCYESLLNFFIEAFNKDLLPNKILQINKRCLVGLNLQDFSL